MSKEKRRYFLNHIVFLMLSLYILSYFFLIDFSLFLSNRGFPFLNYFKEKGCSFSVFRFVGELIIYSVLFLLSVLYLRRRGVTERKYMIRVLLIGIVEVFILTYYHIGFLRVGSNPIGL